MFARQLYNFHNIVMTACKDKKTLVFMKKHSGHQANKNNHKQYYWYIKNEYIYDHESYGSCFQSGLIWICWMFLICSRRTLGRITLHKARLSGVSCVGSIKATFGQSQSPHPFMLEWWASGGINNAFLHRCPLLHLSALEVMKKSCSLVSLTIKWNTSAYRLWLNNKATT